MCSINIVESVEDAGQTLDVNELREISSKQDPLIERWRRYVIDKTLLRTSMQR